MRRLASWFALVTVSACGGGSSDPPGEIDDDFPLPLAAGLSPTPPMGWNSWNKFACNINASFVKSIADAMSMPVDVSLIGKRRLKLLVTNAEDVSALDRASWGDAKVECAA